MPGCGQVRSPSGSKFSAWVAPRKAPLAACISLTDKEVVLKLVIVESPAKAKTISKFLGKDYEVVASYGHIRDLPSSADEIPDEIRSKPWARMAVDVDNDFTAHYVVQKESKKRIAELKRSLRNAEEVVLATDEDREGESISWHLLETLKPNVPIKRIVFHEITKTAIDEAIANPRHVDPQLVRAQETRRILDRLYGYSLSPVLWKKVRTKLSAGRVQSVAVRLVVEREEERRAFRTADYWDVEAELEKDGIAFKAALVSLDGKRVASGKDFDETTGELISTVDSKTKRPRSEDVVWIQAEDAQRIADSLQAALPWKTAQVDQREAKLRPQPPFITSTLQQAASAILGFSPKRTMQLAQHLYEGVDLGKGEREGLITYMRTDSVVLSARALSEAERFISGKFGDRYHHRRQFTTKSKMAQEAHEAIRPTHLDKTPEMVAPILKDEELRLYRLIWRRTIASQMADAQLLKTTVNFEADASGALAILRSNGSVVTFDGFLRVADSGQEDSLLPKITQDMRVGPSAGARQEAPGVRHEIALNKLSPAQHTTKPPARYTEATLIRRLEEEGIGRPSTYAPTITIIQQRGYVRRTGKALVPAFLGIAVTLLLRKHFAEYVDLNFTARMEDVLDGIANGQEEAVAFLSAFYRGHGPFGPGLENRIAQELPQIEFPAIPVGEDPETGDPIVVRLGKTFAFLQRGSGGEGNSATISDEVTYEDLKVEQALEILATRARASEAIGTDPGTGLEVFVLLGPYGPYAQLGKAESGDKKPKRASLPRNVPLESVTLELALQHLSLPRDLGKHPESSKVIRTAIGRFGPYIVHDGDFRSLEKTDDVFTITFERALELLAQPKRSRGAKKLLRKIGGHPESGKPIELYEGRYGPYVSDGAVNATVPKNSDLDGITLEAALGLLAEAAERKPAGKKKAAAKKKPAAKKKAAAKKKSAAKEKAAAKKKTTGEA